MGLSINTWLQDRQRKYADGLAIFASFAPEDMRKKYLSYFQEVGDVPAFDNHFSVLINKLTIIRNIVGNKELDVAPKITEPLESVEGNSLVKDLLRKEAEMLELRDRIQELEIGNSDNEDSLYELDESLREVTETVLNLQKKLSESKQGVKVVTYSSMPEEIQVKYNRIRKITPLYAAAFTEMQNESLSEEERANIAKEVYELYFERADLWNQIDEWAEGKEVSLEVDEKKMEELPVNDVLKGIQVANRIERLKENIRRTETSVKQHEANGKLNLLQKAQGRLDEYREELARLNEIIK